MNKEQLVKNKVHLLNGTMGTEVHGRYDYTTGSTWKLIRKTQNRRITILIADSGDRLAVLLDAFLAGISEWRRYENYV